ncbi:MAG: CoA pyrophosphatase [Clostridiales bacterium]
MNNLETLIHKLPAKPGIQGREKYFNSAVLVPLILIKDEYHLLFQKRAQSISQGNEICFPGGKFESEIDKGYADTAIRETCEELGIHESNIKLIGQMDTIVAPMGATVDVFIGTINHSVINTLSYDVNEVEEVFSIPVSLLKDIEVEKHSVGILIHPSLFDENGNETILLPSKELGLPKKYQTPWTGRKYRVLVYKTDYGIIWGITAEIIFDFLGKYS